MSAKRKFLIDCDAGNDDAEAIFMALSTPDVDVIGITTVCGNIGAVQVGRNCLRLLKVAGRMDIPVYIGCTEPLLGEEKYRTPHHGNDGFGEVPDPSAPDESHFEKEHGVQTILRMAKEHSGELTLVCLGPLTNVAVALRMDPNLGQKLKHCYVMGGTHRGQGNMTPVAEFNVYWDPEAAFVALEQLKCPLTVMPWETSLDHRFDLEFYNYLRGVGTPKAELLRTIDLHSIKRMGNLGTLVPADELCMATALRHDVIKTSVDVYATIELAGKHTPGQMIIDWMKHYEKDSNITLVTSINDKVFQNMLCQASDTKMPSHI